MSHAVRIPPARRSDLLLKPIGNDGRHVVKDAHAGTFYNLGPVESFLLLALDGRQTTEAISAAYAERFSEPLSREDLEDFVDLAWEQGFLQPDEIPDWDDIGEA